MQYGQHELMLVLSVTFLFVCFFFLSYVFFVFEMLNKGKGVLTQFHHFARLLEHRLFSTGMCYPTFS